MTLKKIILVLILNISFLSIFGQSNLQIQNIGNFVTTSNDTIKNCKVGYRTLGALNKDKNNVVFMPTWLMGTSEDNLEYLTSIIDTEGLYVIVVDALGNGISSSPTNYPGFPVISIRDMVNSQYELLENHLKIDHVDLLIGVSMGGMQAFEWMVGYPEFMEQLIVINGTTKLSFYDKVLWNTIATLIEDAGTDEDKLNDAMKRVKDISMLTSTSPTYVSTSYEGEDFGEIMSNTYNRKDNPHNRLTQVKAILNHDIYKNGYVKLENIKNLVKAHTFIITAEQDHVVNPIYSREISKLLGCDSLELTGDCGHIAAFCDVEMVKKGIEQFLNK